MNRLWLTKWDEEMIGLLKPLAKLEQPVIMRMMLFANTFPLAYHYALALEYEGHDPNKYLIQAQWGSEAPEKSKFLSYSTEQVENSIWVTAFQPRLAFVERTLYSAAVEEHILKGNSGLMRLSSFLESALVKFRHRYSAVAVFAETMELGSALEGAIAEIAPKVDVLIYSTENALSAAIASRPSESTLRLFIYGGALSSYLRRKRNRYISLELGPIRRRELNTFLHLPEAAIPFRDQLSAYHDKLFADAREPSKAGDMTTSVRCPPFFAIYRAFNELSFLLQQRSSFSDVQDFTKCLVEHHSH